MEDPEEVTKAHQEFVNAGADIILTNSYRVTVPLIMECTDLNYNDADKVVQVIVLVLHPLYSKVPY